MNTVTSKNWLDFGLVVVVTCGLMLALVIA